MSRAGFARRHEVTYDRVDPGYFIDTKNDSRARTNFKFINRCASQQVTENFDALHHLFTELFFNNLLHGLGYKFQIALIGDLKFDFVPDIGKERPRIVINELVEHFFVRKLNQATTRTIAGNVLDSEFAQLRVHVDDIDAIAGSIPYLA